MKILLIALLSPILGFSQQTSLCPVHGVVTYFFNEYQGYKPDIGATVYAVKDSLVRKFNYSAYDTFYNASFWRNLKQDYGSMSIPENVKQRLHYYRGDDEGYFRDLDNRVFNSFIDIEANRYSVKTTVDGSGNFSLSLAPGNYYVYIQSNNRKGRSLTELVGKVYCKSISVESGGNYDVSTKFDLH